MSAEDRTKFLPESVALAAEKARALRVTRLRTTLEQRLDNPIAAVDALMSELGDGDSQVELWERLHNAAARDGLEAALADAYAKCANGVRMKRLAPAAQAEFLIHAANYFENVRGDRATAEGFLERILVAVPGHPEAFTRLERALEKRLETRRLAELYAAVASAPPRNLPSLATAAMHRVLQLQPKDPLSDDACRKLIALVPGNPRLLDALEAHCKATKRHALACTMIEEALLHDSAPPSSRAGRLRKLVDLYMGEAAAAARAMPHVEALLASNPSDAHALKVAERLLSTREVASRAASALQTARRSRNA